MRGRLVGRLEVEALAVAASVLLFDASYELIELTAPRGLSVDYIEVDGVPISFNIAEGRARRPWYGVRVKTGDHVALFAAPTKQRAEALFGRVGELVTELTSKVQP